MQKAEESELDLIAISPGAQPIVCKIMDYGKYKFELLKKEKESRKKQKVVVVKEIRMSPSIDKHDVQIKINHAIKFLKDEYKLKVSIQFKGREVIYKQIGEKILNTFLEGISEYGTTSKSPTVEGSSLVVNIEPKK